MTTLREVPLAVAERVEGLRREDRGRRGAPLALDLGAPESVLHCFSRIGAGPAGEQKKQRRASAEQGRCSRGLDLVYGERTPGADLGGVPAAGMGPIPPTKKETSLMDLSLF